ncbi:MAG: hypothetical protein L0H28_11635, partial [Corynebacterium casei]|nr:hypothetical protein [Corynebacterium casei]
MLNSTLSQVATDKMIATYRHLHQNPELSMQEHKTQEFIEAELDDIGLEHFRCGGTGVVAIDKHGDGPVVAFRADTDALPIKEATGVEYASESTGELDGATVPVAFEPRLIKVDFAREVSVEEIDAAADEATLGLDDTERAKIEASVAVMNAV